MIADNGLNRDSLTADEAALLQAYRAGDVNGVVKVVGTKINATESAQQENQKAYALDIIAVELVKAVDDVIDDLAYRLATARGSKSRWAQERAADDLLRELAQFLTRSELDKSDEGEYPIAHRHHFADPLFAHEWFGVSVLADGTLISTKE